MPDLVLFVFRMRMHTAKRWVAEYEALQGRARPLYPEGFC